MKKIVLTMAFLSILNGSTFNEFYNQGNMEYKNGHIDKAYIAYSKAYNEANSKKEKIKSLGALAEVSKRQNNYNLAKEYAQKILSIDPSNRYAKNILNSLKSKNSSRLTKEKIMNLICYKPLGDKCNCKDVKFINDSYMPNEKMEIEKIIKGNFVHKNEAVVSLIGCEAHVSNYGGYIFLRKKGRDWEYVKYETPYLGVDCKKVKLKNNKDGFICNSGYSNQGYTDDMIVLYYFDRYLKLKDKVLYRGESNGAAYEKGKNDPRYKDTTIKSWRLVKRGNELFVIIKAYDEDVKHKNRFKTIKKRVY